MFNYYHGVNKMKKIVFIFFLVFSITNLVSDIYSNLPFNQLYRYDLEVIDARAEALGRCSILCSSGANQLFNNPALLSTVTRKNIQLSGRVIFGKMEEGYSYKLDGERKFNVRLNAISYAMPLYTSESETIKIGAGIGYRSYYDLSAKDIYTLESKYFKVTSTSKKTGGYNTIVLGSGVSYDNRFQLGGSISIPFLSYYSDHTYDSNYDETLKGEISGSFFTFSSSYTINSKIIIASRFRTGFKLKWNNDDEDETNNQLKIPYEIAFALNIKPNNKYNLFIEYLTRNYSKYDLKTNETSPYESELFEGLNNGFSLRGGLEREGKINLRTGIFGQSLPIYKGVDEAVYSKEPEREIGVTSGFGFKIRHNLELNFYGSFSYLHFKDSVTYSASDFEQTYANYKFGTMVGYDFL